MVWLANSSTISSSTSRSLPLMVLLSWPGTRCSGWLYFRRRTGQTALGEVAVNVGYAPFGQVEVIALVIQIGIVEVTLLFFRNGFGVFVLLYQLGVTRTAGSSRAVDCDNDGQRTFYRFNATVDVTFHFDFAVTYFQNLFSVCDLRQTKFFCHLRTYLCRHRR